MYKKLAILVGIVVCVVSNVVGIRTRETPINLANESAQCLVTGVDGQWYKKIQFEGRPYYIGTFMTGDDGSLHCRMACRTTNKPAANTTVFCCLDNAARTLLYFVLKRADIEVLHADKVIWIHGAKINDGYMLRFQLNSAQQYCLRAQQCTRALWERHQGNDFGDRVPWENIDFQSVYPPRIASAALPPSASANKVIAYGAVAAVVGAIGAGVDQPPAQSASPRTDIVQKSDPVELRPRRQLQRTPVQPMPPVVREAVVSNVSKRKLHASGDAIVPCAAQPSAHSANPRTDSVQQPDSAQLRPRRQLQRTPVQQMQPVVREGVVSTQGSPVPATVTATVPVATSFSRNQIYIATAAIVAIVYIYRKNIVRMLGFGAQTKSEEPVTQS